jgi:lysophospholipase L1-like esterase
VQIRRVSLLLIAVACLLASFGLFAENGPAAEQPRGDRGGGQPSHWQLALETDPADLKVYREANANLPPPAPDEDRVVFIGDSITENWGRSFNRLFAGKPYIGRGYTSETTQQILIRFRPDVIELQPKVVVILAGTNDIAGNTGRSTQAMIEDNLISMFELAEHNNIRVVLVSVLPASDYWWQPGMEPAEKIVALNVWMKEYAAEHGIVYVDCHTPMSDENHGMQRQYSYDGVHPSPAGFALMSELTEAGIAEALRADIAEELEADSAPAVEVASPGDEQLDSDDQRVACCQAVKPQVGTSGAIQQRRKSSPVARRGVLLGGFRSR